MMANPVVPKFDALKIISVLAAALVAILALLAFVLSYHSLQHLAAANQVDGWLSYLWPLLLDFAMIVYSLAILRANLRGEPAWYPWLLTGIFAGLATVANVLDVTSLGIPAGAIAASVKAIAPFALVLAFELLMQMVKADVKRSTVLATLSQLADQIDRQRRELAELLTQKQGELDRLNGQLDQARAKLAALQSDLKVAQNAPKHRSGSELTAAKLAKIAGRRDRVLALLTEGMSPGDIAGQLGVTVRTIRRDISALNGQVASVQGMSQ